jgi:hypothetical protein
MLTNKIVAYKVLIVNEIHSQLNDKREKTK